MLSFLDVSLRRQVSMTQAEKFGPFCSRAMLICSIIWLGKSDVAGCCSAGSVLHVDIAPVFSVAGFVLSEVVFTLLMTLFNTILWCHN